MKNKILIFGFSLIILTLPIYSFILKDEALTYSERRKLASMPKISLNAIFNGQYFEDLNDYFVDQFPYRDEFRKLKGTINNKFLNMQVNNDTFIKDNMIYQLDTSINEKSLKHFTNTLNKVQKDYFKNNKVYYSIIPDKNYYLTDKSIPRLDYNKIFNQIATNLNDQFRYIDITRDLSLNSYYSTDIHWKQEELRPVVQKLSRAMDFSINNYPTKSKTYSPFYGALYGRVATNIKPDTITYVTSDIISNLTVFNYEKNRNEKVYQEELLTGIDSYDVFLSGATPLLIITNNNQENNRELVIFRDSFASSLTPLIAEAYSKITLIDLRYLSSDLLRGIDEIDLTSPDLDILFLYSIPVINNSFTLK